MARMQLLVLTVLHYLLFGITSAAPSGLMNEEVSFNETTNHPLLYDRSLEKREAFFRCGHPAFSGTLAQAIQDASDIITNMVAHLELAISLYNEDGSGELRDDKATKGQRTFDEHNAFGTYLMFITRHYWGPGDSRNKAGFEKLKGTRDLAKVMKSQYAAYVEGRSVPWTRGGFPYINIYCDDADVYSERNSAGLTFTQDTGKPNPQVENEGKKNEVSYYFVSQIKGIEDGGELWVPRFGVCAIEEGGDKTRFGVVPVDPGIKAYVYGAIFPKLLEESMVFCPIMFDKWISADTDRTANGLHYRDLHVDIGSSPTDAQKTASTKLLAEGDFTGQSPRAIRWLNDFLVSTMLHESTHSAAFAGVGNTLVDVGCTDNGKPDGARIQTSVNPGCMAQIAKGVDGLDAKGNSQGHKDAQGFAMYAMATWVNTVYWYRGFLPRDRDTYLN